MDEVMVDRRRSTKQGRLVWKATAAVNHHHHDDDDLLFQHDDIQAT